MAVPSRSPTRGPIFSGEPGRTIVNWDVAATDWEALKVSAQRNWVKISEK